MKNLLACSLSLFVLLSLFSSCKKEKLNIDVPECIKKQIKEIKNKPVSNPPAQVWKWEYEKANYFYVTSGCCDKYTYLYDEYCNEVCAPDGGITGNGDGKCSEFDVNINKIEVWEDNRS